MTLLLNPIAAIAIVAVLSHVHLELLLRALQLPIAVAIADEVHIETLKLHLKIRVPKQHATQVRHVAQAVVHAERTQERDRPQDHDEVLGLDWKQEAKEQRAVGIQKTEGHQQPIDCARSANHADIHFAEQQIDDHHTNSGANPADKVVSQEAFGSPLAFQIRSEHPQRQHVEQNVREAIRIVQKHVSEKLPHRQMLDYGLWHQREKEEDLPRVRASGEEVDDEERDVRNQQPLYATRQRAGETGAGIAGPRVVSHENLTFLRISTGAFAC